MLLEAFRSLNHSWATFTICVNAFFVFALLKLRIFFLKVTNSLPLNVVNFGRARICFPSNSAVKSHISPYNSFYFQIRIIYQFSRKFPPRFYLIHHMLFIYVLIGEVEIHPSHSDQELKHPILPPMCLHLIIYGNMIHSLSIIIIHTVLVTILVITDIRVEEFGDCAHTGCMDFSGVAPCISSQCCRSQT